MQRMGNGPTATAAAERPAFPLDLDVSRVWLVADDEHDGAAFTLETAWLRGGNSGMFCLWTDIEFLRENWDGPIVLKGI